MLSSHPCPALQNFIDADLGKALRYGTPIAGALVQGHGDVRSTKDYLGIPIMAGGLMSTAILRNISHPK